MAKVPRRVPGTGLILRVDQRKKKKKPKPKTFSSEEMRQLYRKSSTSFIFFKRL